jgi:hypothetical protein
MAQKLIKCWNCGKNGHYRDPLPLSSPDNANKRLSAQLARTMADTRLVVSVTENVNSISNWKQQ